ncbi:MAG: hypothetical protein HYX21_00015 [Candidatus Yanofskybacteria bacterium]|nr:hypothetical protein [Candidatus Yanofskybacteria bacterium]
MIFELILLAGGGLFFYGDYKNGFPVSKSLLNKGSNVVRGLLRQKEENVTEQIDRLLKEHARAVGLLRESVATVDANLTQTTRRQQEQFLLASEYASVAEEAARVGDEEALTVAVVAKVEAGKRAECFGSHLGDQQRILQALRQNLDLKEMEFDSLKTKAETVKIVAQITEAKRQLYALTSDVEAKAGFTIGGQIGQLLLKVEHEDLKSDSLLGMVQNNGCQKLLQFRQQAEVRKEIEEIRQRICLPPAPHEVEVLSEEEQQV